jgi:hypothetical protein
MADTWKVSGLGYLCRGKTVIAKTNAVPAHVSQSVTLEIADAEYIAKACNAYPTLVAALRAIAKPALGGKLQQYDAQQVLKAIGESLT